MNEIIKDLTGRFRNPLTVQAANEILELKEQLTVCENALCRARKLLTTSLNYIRDASENPQPPTMQAPDGWSYEVATTYKEGVHGGWEQRLSIEQPYIPEGAVRNLEPLYKECKYLSYDDWAHHAYTKVLMEQVNDLSAKLHRLQCGD